MARIRSIHPDACKSEKLDTATAEAERAYWRLQPHCDDEGRCEDDPRMLRSLMFQLSETITSGNVDDWLTELDKVGLIVRYAVDGRRFIAVTAWATYQHPKHPKPSTFPPPVGIVGDTTDPSFPLEGDDGNHGEGEGRGDARPDGAAPFEDDFNESWKHYPRKLARKDALKAYQARRREGISAEQLLGAVVNFADAMAGRSDEHIMHGGTFFGPSERWHDYREPVKPTTNGKRPADPEDDRPRPLVGPYVCPLGLGCSNGWLPPPADGAEVVRCGCMKATTP